ncbi:GntR family transcriptional regulator [Cryobacterium sp. Y50]|uniref:GntR family transcriptional regulator n=1 Tax=Cryobacterium sp. Y50 TaxID=2048286 RepID=UPI000CE30058|nr:GntR family transcriptional regulator [Cryobacterium sp. Y50]
MSTDALSLRGVDRQSLREQSVERLREAIETGVLAPGQRLIETQVSEALSVSRGTLREAVMVLVYEGLVISDGRGRIHVRRITRKQIQEIFAVRGALESLAARSLAAVPNREAVVAKLRKAIEPLRDTDADLPGLMNADLGFHRLMVELTENETLLDSWEHIYSRVRATVTRAGVELARSNMSWKRHEPIISAIEAGDGEAARAVILEHMEETVARISSLVFIGDNESPESGNLV